VDINFTVPFLPNPKKPKPRWFCIKVATSEFKSCTHNIKRLKTAVLSVQGGEMKTNIFVAIEFLFVFDGFLFLMFCVDLTRGNSRVFVS